MCSEELLFESSLQDVEPKLALGELKACFLGSSTETNGAQGPEGGQGRQEVEAEEGEKPMALERCGGLPGRGRLGMDCKGYISSFTHSIHTY